MYGLTVITLQCLVCFMVARSDLPTAAEAAMSARGRAGKLNQPKPSFDEFSDDPTHSLEWPFVKHLSCRFVRRSNVYRK
jgi:hypothetical protein